MLNIPAYTHHLHRSLNVHGRRQERVHHNDGHRVQSAVRRGRGVVCVRLRSVYNLLSRRHVRWGGGRRNRLRHDGGYGVQSTVRRGYVVVYVG